MLQRVVVGRLSVAEGLYRFVEHEALPGSGIDSSAFWEGADAIIHEFAPKIADLLERRDHLQSEIDGFHQSQLAASLDPDAYERFLREIGYLLDEPDDFLISTADVDTEVAAQSGPQLVVPLLNARFATNAANARWGSLYDALYGTDAVHERAPLARSEGYNPHRGAEVVRRGRLFLDAHFGLIDGSHADSSIYTIDNLGLAVSLGSNVTRLIDPTQLVGYQGTADEPTAVVLIHNGLHVEIRFDRQSSIGSSDSAGIADILLESALSSIMDLEDSVAAVDVDDKVLGYRNWLRLMMGTLTEEVTKGGRTFTRELHPDRSYVAPGGGSVALHGRALLFVRHVGHHMSTDAVLDAFGNPVPEGILDALITGLGSAHDLRGHTARANSRTGSMYVVKPKLHGPEEVAVTVDLFEQVERVLGFPPRTIKMGIMDEERRTTLNLKACIRAASDRIAFINTGFLDRTGDEIHTSMYAGAIVRKDDMRAATWIRAYEMSNVDVGIACGLPGRAQIGKGMWAAPDNMAAMLAAKIEHPRSGASCAWVPSPTAATLHAIHYHQVDVRERQKELAGEFRTSMRELITLPLSDSSTWSTGERHAELDNNLQGVLGYVVRWVDSGIGCSKVPDIHGTPLMEDRATCRISSQHVANWLLHGVVTEGEVEESLRRMASVVDSQNAHEAGYEPMSPDFDGDAFAAARELVIDGARQPNGYTEPILHRHRVAHKARLSELGS